jgi:hypothetical protein
MTRHVAVRAALTCVVVEEAIPAIFKQLGYPFSISKTAVYAAGTPHTWPVSWTRDLRALFEFGAVRILGIAGSVVLAGRTLNISRDC